MEKVASEDISVMVQGPFHDAFTPRCVASIRRWLPRAEVVLSTWRGTDLDKIRELEVDSVVFSDDPSGPNLSGVWARALGEDCVRAQSPAARCYNLNREIVSSQNGLQKVTRGHTLRLRSDSILTGTGFLEYFGKYDDWRSNHYRIFKKRIVALDAFCPTRSAFCMYFSDFCSFGLTEDIQAQWQIPLQPDPDLMGDREYNPLCLIGEQYFWVTLFRKHYPVPLQHMYHKTQDLITLTEASIANNVVIVDLATFGFFLLKYPDLPRWNYTRFTHPWLERISHAEWQIWCKKHCGLPAVSGTEEDRKEILLKEIVCSMYAEYLRSKGLEVVGQYTDALYADPCYPEFMKYCAERYWSGLMDRKEVESGSGRRMPALHAFTTCLEPVSPG